MATEATLTRTSGSLTPLCWLAGKYGTDKLGFYTPIYDLLLSGRRDRVFKVLEVGIGTPEAMKHVPCYRPGASLRMWRDYFPNADIYGLDINMNACIAAEAAGDLHRITLWCGDSASADAAAYVSATGAVDLIVDDGDHSPEVQFATFKALSPLLASRGLYIIEDVNDFDLHHNPNMPEHTVFLHADGGQVGRFILVRQEALAL